MTSAGFVLGLDLGQASDYSAMAVLEKVWRVDDAPPEAGSGLRLAFHARRAQLVDRQACRHGGQERPLRPHGAGPPLTDRRSRNRRLNLRGRNCPHRRRYGRRA